MVTSLFCSMRVVHGFVFPAFFIPVPQISSLSTGDMSSYKSGTSSLKMSNNTDGNDPKRDSATMRKEEGKKLLQAKKAEFQKNQAEERKKRQASGKKQDVKKVPKFKRQASHTGLISQLALKFPLIQSTLNSVHAHFNKYLQKNDHVSVENLKDIMALTGSNMTDDEVTNLFNLSGVEKNNTISYREFLVAIGIGYFLNEKNAGDEQFQRIKSGFKVHHI